MTTENTLKNELNALKTQEEKFQFSHFTAQDIWKLGTQMAETAMRRSLPIAISIRLFSGVTAFQFCCEGANLHNEIWMDRKERTVREMEMSSLRMYTEFALDGVSMEEKLMDRYEYACCGGGFPIRLRNAGVIGVIIVSGLPHKDDHAFIVEALDEYFPN